jgi:hypothetical protein
MRITRDTSGVSVCADCAAMRSDRALRRDDPFRESTARLNSGIGREAEAVDVYRHF